MVTDRACKALTDDGTKCGAPPMRGSDHCFWHDPDHAKEADEARRLGGLRRRKEKTVQGAYDIEGLEDVGQIRRLVEVAVLDGLALENSIARGRLLIAGALAAAKLLEVGELEQRLSELEAAIAPRKETPWKGRRR